MPGFNDAIQQAQQFWATRNARQRGFLIAGGLATVILVGVFVRLIGTPDYKPLYTGLETEDAQTLSTQLDAEGIPHQLSADGKTLSVPANKIDAARLKTAAQGSPHSGRMGFELFDKMSWGQTEFDQKVTYQRSLEGELERTIETVGDVQSARVHLVMSTDSVFLDRQRNAKASVILKLRGRGLSKDAVLAISRLVAGAVDELKPEDVSIIDADSARSLGLHHDGSEDDGDGLDSSLMQRLIATLEPVVGADKIRASVNVDRSRGSSEESQEKYDPSVSALLSDQKTEDNAGGTAMSAGVPGTSSNIPDPKTTKGPASTTPPQGNVQSSKSETAQYGVNRTVVRTMMPAGSIQRVTAALLVDDAVVKTVQGGKTSFTRRKRTAEEMNKIRLLAEAVIGFDAKRGDTISVENMSFDTNASEADIPAPVWTDKVHKAMTDYSSLLRPVSLLLLFLLAYLFVLRPIQKHALSPTQLPAGAQPALAAGAGAGAGANRLTVGTPEIPDSTRRATQLKERTVELVKQKPVNTARAMQAWLSEEPS